MSTVTRLTTEVTKICDDYIAWKTQNPRANDPLNKPFAWTEKVQEALKSSLDEADVAWAFAQGRHAYSECGMEGDFCQSKGVEPWDSELAGAEGVIEWVTSV